MKVHAVILLLAAATSFVSVSDAACANKCSGRGTCGNNDICQCFPGWSGGDCSQKDCPVGLAWADVPYASEKAHAYAPCSNAGTCDKDSGQCSCFGAFTGKSCHRLRCASDCSGHGICEFIEEVAANDWDTNVGGNSSRTYDQWDREKVQVCRCDRGWAGVDCSIRICPKGDDPITAPYAPTGNGRKVTQSNMQQGIKVGSVMSDGSPAPATTGEFVITYFDAYGGYWQTKAIKFNSADCATVASDVRAALKELPHNQFSSVGPVIDKTTNGFWAFKRTPGSNVNFEGAGTSYLVTKDVGSQQCLFSITFPSDPGMSGLQRLFIVETGTRGVGFNPQSAGIIAPSNGRVVATAYETVQDFYIIQQPLTELADCSGRGKCDDSSGLCDCYEGFKGVACELQEVLI